MAQRLPGTLMLIGTSLVTALTLGVSLGAAMARYAGRLPDRILSVLTLLFYSIPGFWIGPMLSGGHETIGAGLTGLDAFLDYLRYTILPSTSLSLFYVAIYAQGRAARTQGGPPRGVSCHVLYGASQCRCCRPLNCIPASTCPTADRMRWMAYPSTWTQARPSASSANPARANPRSAGRCCASSRRPPSNNRTFLIICLLNKHLSQMREFHGLNSLFRAEQGI
jgi:hypothetical protein